MIHKCKLKELFIRFSKSDKICTFLILAEPERTRFRTSGWNRECLERTNLSFIISENCAEKFVELKMAPMVRSFNRLTVLRFCLSFTGFLRLTHICRQSRNNSSYSSHSTTIATECVKMYADATVAMSLGKEHHETSTRKSVSVVRLNYSGTSVPANSVYLATAPLICGPRCVATDVDR